ncbi:peptidoglycan-binding protein [Rhodobacteraceae bacterium]|nr:peptidoglycan-binding protein [Paracoccaceae bacterium]
MQHLLRLAAFLFLSFWTAAATAQSWVQIEAQPSEARVLERAGDYATRLDNVQAFRTGSNWHVVVLGPFDEPEAQQILRQLRAARQIPRDAFISDGRTFRSQVFGGVAATARNPNPDAPPIILEPGEETPAEARQGERSLTRDDRAQLQVALRWEGFYNSTIDASFGPGTRRAMAAWQSANGFEATGILTTLQRTALVEGYLSVLDSLALAPIIDANAGIEINLPTGLVAFDRYNAPFVNYSATTEDDVRVILISQTGDGNTLAALYDIMQTLEIVPLDGSRALRNNSFTLEGANDEIISHTFVRIAGNAIKGFALIWPAGDEKRFRLALDAMQATFRTSDAVLPDSAGQTEQNIDLLSGLEIRRADRARSGFYIDGDGAVLTTLEAVGQCGRITLDDETDAVITAQDTGLGLALLTPTTALSPLSVAKLATAQPRLQADIAIAGYSFGGVLSAPTLTYGTLADLKGLNGDTRVQRLSVTSEPSDAGGPVFAGSGAVTGMLLNRENDGRRLPDDVAFAADASVLAAFLSENGVSISAIDLGADIAPEDLTLLAADMTVLVSCWN